MECNLFWKLFLRCRFLAWNCSDSESSHWAEMRGESCGGIYYLSNHENMRLQWKEEAVKVKERFQRCDKEWKDAFNMFIVSASSPYRLCCCCASLWHSWLFFCAACAFAPAQFKTINYDKSLALFIEKKKMGSKRAREGSFSRYRNLLSCNISTAVVWIAAATVNGWGKSRSSLEPPTSLVEIWICSLVTRLDTVAATQSSSLLLSLISSFTLFNLSFCISRASVWLTSATFKLRNNTTTRSEAAILCCWNRQIAHHLNYRYRSD